MVPVADFPPPVQLLYLLAFAAGAAGLILPLISGGRKGDSGLRAGRFLQVLVITGILPSLQVILDAMEITPNLEGAWPLNLTIFFNSLIIAGISLTVMAWSQLTMEIYPARPVLEKIRTGMLLTVFPAAAATITGQSLALLRPGNLNLALAGGSLMVLLILLFTVSLEAAVRTFTGKNRDLPIQALILLRGMIPTAGAWTVLYSILPEKIAAFVPPLGLLSLFIAAMVLFMKIPEHQETRESAREKLLDNAALTPREREIAMMLARGLSYKDISEELFVSLSTVQTHVGRIYGKMEVKNKTELSRKLTEGP